MHLRVHNVSKAQPTHPQPSRTQTGIFHLCHLWGQSETGFGQWTRISLQRAVFVFCRLSEKNKKTLGEVGRWGWVLGWRVSNELEKKLGLFHPLSRVQKFVDVFGGRKFVLQTSKLCLCWIGSHKAGMIFEWVLKLLENATIRACPGWLSWGNRAALGQGPPREEPQRPFPPPTLSLDSAFMHIYFKVCIQMCGFSGRNLRGGRQMRLCWMFWAPAIETQRKRVYFFKLAQMGHACGLLALALATRLCKHRVASPPGRVLTVMPYRLIGCHWRATGCFFLVSVVLQGSLGAGNGHQVIWFCPFVRLFISQWTQLNGWEELAFFSEDLCSICPMCLLGWKGKFNSLP